MAVENKYTNADVISQNKAITGQGGHELVVLTGYAAIAAADDDGSVYGVFKAVPSSFRPVRITVQCTAITGGTDYELGVYQPGTTAPGAVVNKGLFMTNQTLATASRSLDGLAAVTVAVVLAVLARLPVVVTTVVLLTSPVVADIIPPLIVILDPSTLTPPSVPPDPVPAVGSE